MTYRNKLLLSISAVFVVFALISISVGIMNTDSYKRAILKSRLESYADVVARSDSAAAVMRYFPAGVRVSVIDPSGTVLFDSERDASLLPNHALRPEIRECLENGEGFAIRRSATSSRKYFYFAKDYGGYIVRTAQDFEVDLEKFFRTDWVFLLFIFFLLLCALLSLIFLSDRYERKEAARTAKETRRLKHEMTSNISHELKTPVCSIQGYLETIVNHPELGEDRRQLFIERSYLQALRLSDMISDISIITKLEEVPEQFKVAPVNIKVVFSEVIEEMSDQLAAHGIGVENALPPLCVRGNYHLIYAIFRNLLENTMKYAGEGSRAVLSYSPGPDGAHEFDYRDDGRGVEEAQLEKIFERFYRLDADRSKPVGGSGLGLSIIRNAVLFHDGEIRAYCVPGGGLGFRFTLRDLKQTL